MSRLLTRCVVAAVASASVLRALPTSADVPRATIAVRRAPLNDALIEVGKRFDVNVVLLQDFPMRISVSLTKVTLDEALDALLATRGITYVRNASLVIVGTRGMTRATQAVRRDSDVVSLTNVPAKDAIPFLRAALPRLTATRGPTSNVLVLDGSHDDLATARRLLGSIDVPDPAQPVSGAIVLQHADARAIAPELQRMFPAARFSAGAGRTVIADGAQATLDRAKAAAASLDQSPPIKALPSQGSVAAFTVVRARPDDVAQAISRALPHVRAGVAGSGQVIVTGSPNDIARAKEIAQAVDRPPISERYLQIYRLHTVDARSVGDLVSRSYRDANVAADTDLNSLAITATSGEHERIADAIAQLDGAAPRPGVRSSAGPPVSQAGSDQSTGTAEVITLKAAVPGISGPAPTSATDIATAVGQALAISAPDLHITVPANATQLILTGSPNAIRQAKDLIDKLDTLQKLVVLDTEIYEIDESTAKTLGLRFVNPILSTTYTETTPSAPAGGALSPPLLGLQQLARSPLSLGAQLDFAISNGNAKIIADPRLTTISGRTASLRAGSNLAIQTQVGGGTGTVATTQIQTFQTGVTLDITPVINEGDYISVTLHPTVNSNTGFVAGIPQISTRDTQTTVAMHEGQTLFIGGLIEEDTTRNETKIPFLGDLPGIGKIFRDTQLTSSRNELVITVTPHIIDPLDPRPVPPPPAIGAEPQAFQGNDRHVLQGFPTLAPSTTLRTPAPHPAAASSSEPRQTKPSAHVEATPPAAVAVAGASPPAATAAASNVSLPASSGHAETAAPNTFVYGTIPSTPLSSSTSDPPTIAYVSESPVSFRAGASLHVEAVTSTNVSRMTIGYSGFVAPVSMTTPGSWKSNLTFINSGLGQMPQKISLTLTAYKQDGSLTTVAIPVSVTP